MKHESLINLKTDDYFNNNENQDIFNGDVSPFNEYNDEFKHS